MTATANRNALTDVTGIKVGHHTAIGDGYLTGTTVVLAPPGGMTAGVDVRGGGPGTRETDLLAPTAAVEKVHAIVLTGGSAYGLAAASGVADALGEQGIGIRVGRETAEVVPIVPAAVVFDLGRGGSFAARPTAEFGALAVADALASGRDTGETGAPGNTGMGTIGAGTGSLTGRLKGGIGQASLTLPGGLIISALVVANATGLPYDPETGELWGARLLRPEDGRRPGLPTVAELAALNAISAEIGAGLAAATTLADSKMPNSGDAVPDEHGRDRGEGAESISHTTLGVVATNATLTKAQCAKMAGMAHDGLARAVNPVHTMIDGDLFFGVATGEFGAPNPGELFALQTAAADVVTRAMVRALLAAETIPTPTGTYRSYLDVAPSTVA